MSTRIFYFAWQMQCCGDPFRIGDSVSWTAIPAVPGMDIELGAAEATRINWVEEHHQDVGEEVVTVTGQVAAIRAIRQRYVQKTPDLKFFVPVDGDVLTADVTEANGWESDAVDPNNADYHFRGYVVTLT